MKRARKAKFATGAMFALALWLPSAPNAASVNSCGGGFITNYVVNDVDSSDASVDILLDFSLEAPASTKFFYSPTWDENNKYIRMRKKNSNSRFLSALRTLQSAFLSGSPVRILRPDDSSNCSSLDVDKFTILVCKDESTSACSSS